MSARYLTACIEAIQIIIKSSKPAQSYNLSVQPTDTIADIKAHLASQSGAPPADVQRLLLKGKALADSKLLKEYSVKDGDTVNLMVKPGFDWDPSRPVAEPTPFPTLTPDPIPAPIPSPSLAPDSKPSRSHQRIPSVVLSPSPNSLTPIPGEKPVDIPLTLDSSTIGSPSQSNIPVSSYQITISQPQFWEQLLAFLLQVPHPPYFTLNSTLSEHNSPPRTMHISPLKTSYVLARVY
jgi:hypothetical protein